MKRKIKKHHNRRELPPVGTQLRARYLKENYFAKVVEYPLTADGRGVKYRNKIYTSMSAAAEAVTKQPANGWTFWRFDQKLQ